MRDRMRWAAPVMALVALTTACGEKVTKLDQDITIKMTANCTSPSQIFVDVDQWQAEVKKKGTVTFEVTSTSTPVAVVTITPKSADQWPFTDPNGFEPKNGNNKRVAKDPSQKTTYYYNLNVACAIGTGTDSARVVIDPDIIVN